MFSGAETKVLVAISQKNPVTVKTKNQSGGVVRYLILLKSFMK